MDHEVSTTIRRVLIASSDGEAAAAICSLIDPGPTRRFACEVAPSLVTALERLRVEAFDVVLLDLALDGADGLATMRTLRAKVQAPIVILTQAGSEQMSLRCLELGAQEYLPKEDLNTQNLRRALGYAISHYRANDLRLRLEHSDKLAALGQLAAGVAHEINNPATYVLGNLCQIQDVIEQLMSGEGGHDDLKLIAEMARDCHRGVEIIADISRELTYFARADDASMAPVNIKDLVTNTSAMTLNEIRYRARFEQRVADDLPDVLGNRSKLSQVLVNLLINAAHAITKGSSADNQISITADVEEGQVVIRVKDTGCGIPESALERVFVPYYTTKAQGLGTGLGLPICKEIVLQHRGKLAVSSEVDVGTVFTLRLPVAASFDAVTTEDPKVQPDPQQPVRKRILVIDDEPLLLKSIARMLQAHHDVVPAAGGSKALEVLASDAEFDVIICDLMMPAIDGMHVYQALQRDHRELVDKLIYLSGGVFTTRMTAFVDEIGAPFLEKPVSRDQLLAAIGSLSG